MVQKINRSAFVGRGPIKMLYPGKLLSATDTGIGSIGRIDHPEFRGKTVIPMHPHVNDEILSYFRTGKAEHRDSGGFEKTIGQSTLMLMKAGILFQHEEKILGADEVFEGLQIFIRPGRKDLAPEVSFLELETLHSENAWRLLASPNPETQFQFSSQTWIYDCKLLQDSRTLLPKLPRSGLSCLLYIFKGQAAINNSMELSKMDSLLIRDEEIQIDAINGDVELVLFVTDEAAASCDTGMYSGNQA